MPRSLFHERGIRFAFAFSSLSCPVFDVNDADLQLAPKRRSYSLEHVEQVALVISIL
jgi:hypothetical protein